MSERASERVSETVIQSVSQEKRKTNKQSVTVASKLEDRQVGTQSAVSRVWVGESVANGSVGRSYHF